MRNLAAGFLTAGMLFSSSAIVANPTTTPSESTSTLSARQQRIDEHQGRIRQILLESQQRKGQTSGMSELKLPQISTESSTRAIEIEKHQERIRQIIEESDRRRRQSGKEFPPTTASHILDQLGAASSSESSDTINARQQRINNHQARIKQILLESQQRIEQTTAMPEVKLPLTHKSLPTNAAIVNEELPRTRRMIEEANQRRQQRITLTSATAAQTMDQLDDQLDAAMEKISKKTSAPLNFSDTAGPSMGRGLIPTKQALAEAFGLTTDRTTDRLEVVVPPGGEIKVSTPQGQMKTVSASPDTTLVIRTKDLETSITAP